LANTLALRPHWQFSQPEILPVNIGAQASLIQEFIMGIVSFSNSPVFSVLLAPMQALAAWFVPAQAESDPFAAPARTRRTPHQLAVPFKPGSIPSRRRAAAAHAAAAKTSAPSRLKVVREFDAAVGPACAGRMVISGRMADVCAELERMAQRETAVQ
jgi:hypothetical protein